MSINTLWSKARHLMPIFTIFTALTSPIYVFLLVRTECHFMTINYLEFPTVSTIFAPFPVGHLNRPPDFDNILRTPDTRIRIFHRSNTFMYVWYATWNGYKTTDLSPDML